MVPGTKAINSQTSIEDASRKANSYNTPENLKSFFDVNKEDVLFVKALPDGYAVSEFMPSAPYSEEGVMICAGNLKELGEGKVSTQNIYDLPEDVQKEYWRITLANLIVLGEETKDSNRFRVLATENTTPRTGQEHRTSRSIDVPHIQINRFDRNKVVSGEELPSSLQTEQRVLRDEERIWDFAKKIRPDMGLKILPRLSEPYGYSLFFGMDARTALTSISEFQELMLLHHQAYTREARKMVEKLRSQNQKRIIPQPSYRTYIFFNEGRLEVVISPEFLSHAGVTEAAGLEMVRSSDVKSDFSSDELTNFKRRIAAEAQEKIETDREITAHSLTEINEKTKTYIGSLVNYDEKGRIIPIAEVLRGVEHVYTSPRREEIHRLKLDMDKKEFIAVDYDLGTTLRMSGVDTTSDAEKVLKSKSINQDKTSGVLDIVWLSGKDLGFESEWVSQKEIYDRAEALGLTKCPPKAGPFLALRDNREGVRYLVAMRGIVSQGRPRSFFIYGIGRHGLDAVESYPTKLWQDAYVEFAFSLPPKQ